jgi:hypothetical protein
VVVEVVEERVPDLAQPQAQAELKEAVLVYSREVAFAAADIYARAAEARGSWDARLEAMVIDALVRGDSVDELASRSAAFGWQSQGSVAVLIGRAPRRSAHKSISEIRRAARKWAEDVLVGVHDDRLLIVLGGADDLEAAALALSHYYGPSDVVVGPQVSTLAEAGTSAASALWALRTASAWQSTPRPVHADQLLPERAIAGDDSAVTALIEGVHAPLAAGSGSLLVGRCTSTPTRSDTASRRSRASSGTIRRSPDPPSSSGSRWCSVDCPQWDSYRSPTIRHQDPDSCRSLRH